MKSKFDFIGNVLLVMSILSLLWCLDIEVGRAKGKLSPLDPCYLTDCSAVPSSIFCK